MRRILPGRKNKILKALFYSLSAILIILLTYYYFHLDNNTPISSYLGNEVIEINQPDLIPKQQPPIIPDMHTETTTDTREPQYRPDSKPTETTAQHTQTGMGEAANAPSSAQPPVLSLDREAEQRMLEAVKAYNARDFKAAASLLSDISKDDTRALLPLGLSYYGAKDYKRAKYYLRESLLHGGDFLAYKALAYISYEDNDLNEAIAYAQKGLALKPDPALKDLLKRAEQDKALSKDIVTESTAHFSVISNGYIHSGVGRLAIDILEEAYRDIGREIDVFPSGSVTAIFYTDKDFYAVTRQPDWTQGLYDGKIRIPLRGAEAHEKELRRVLYHEYTHALIHSITPDCPTWLHEGLAEYFSGGRKEVGQVIPLRQLEASFFLLGGNVDTAYSESYSAVKYLIDTQGINRVKRLLISLGEGKDFDTAFLDAFFMTYDRFADTWGK